MKKTKPRWVEPKTFSTRNFCLCVCVLFVLCVFMSGRILSTVMFASIVMTVQTNSIKAVHWSRAPVPTYHVDRKKDDLQLQQGASQPTCPNELICLLMHALFL